MKKYLFLLLLLAFCGPSKGQDSLTIKIDSLLQDPMFETSQVALMVYDLTDDVVLYQKNERQMMRPASTMKLVTAITALDRLGGHHEFVTRMCYTGTLENGKLDGDLYCVGGFDPMVTPEEVRAMVQQVHLLGVDTLQGCIWADHTMKEALDYGEGWCWDDDNPMLKPLTVGRKDIFTQMLVDELCEDSVVLLDTRIGERSCPSDARALVVIRHNMDQALLRMMKKSDNFYAEAVFYQIGFDVAEHRTAKASDARNGVKQLLRKIGVKDGSYKIADGSGLSLYNYVSAELEIRLLRYAWRNHHIYNHLNPSLPIAGVDGTLEKRMCKSAAEGNVRAKTGTLTGISSLAGYCTAANGHELAFCIINQGVLRNKDGKDFQDKVCQVLCE